jgi:3D (Asp-Asp-Asp) domain-containing protein
MLHFLFLEWLIFYNSVVRSHGNILVITKSNQWISDDVIATLKINKIDTFIKLVNTINKWMDKWIVLLTNNIKE